MLFYVILDGRVDLSSESPLCIFSTMLAFLHTYNKILTISCPPRCPQPKTLIREWPKSGSGAPGPESAPRRNKTTTLFFRHQTFRNTFRSTCRNTFRNTFRNTSVCGIDRTASVSNISISKFRVEAWGYARQIDQQRIR